MHHWWGNCIQFTIFILGSTKKVFGTYDYEQHMQAKSNLDLTCATFLVFFSCNIWNFQCSSALGRTSTETLRVRCRFQLKRRSWNSHNSDSTVEHGFLNVTRCWKCHFQKKFSAGSKFSFRQLRSFGSHDQPQNEDCYLWCILTKTYLFDCLSTFVLDMQEFVG